MKTFPLWNGGSQVVSTFDYTECMGKISAPKLEQQCPEGIVVTTRGKPVALLTPSDSNCETLIGSMQGKIQVAGDVGSTGTTWNATF